MTPVRSMNKNAFVKHAFYLFPQHGFSTYGTRCGGSVLASSHLDALPLLMFFIGLHSLQQADYMQTNVVPSIDQIVLCTHLIRKGILRIWRSHPVRSLVIVVTDSGVCVLSVCVHNIRLVCSSFARFSWLNPSFLCSGDTVLQLSCAYFERTMRCVVA